MRLRSFQSRGQSQGFTLIEVIASFTILSMTFMVILEILSNSSTNTIKSSERTKIALLAQSKMDEVGIVIPVEEGVTSGEFEDGLNWDVEITPHEIEYEGGSNLDFAPVELFKVILTISWEDGLGKIRSTEFMTLKAMSPNFESGRGVK